MRIDAPKKGDVRHVVDNIRPADADEFMAVSRFQTWDAHADHLVALYGGRDDTFCAYHGDTPVAIGAFVETWPGVVSIGLFASTDFPKIGRALTKFVRKRLIPSYQKQGIHRIACISKSDYAESHRWIEAIGLTKESEMRGFGRNGETFFQFSQVCNDVAG